MYWDYRNLRALQHDLSFNVFSLTKLNVFNASSIPCVGEPFNQHVFLNSRPGTFGSFIFADFLIVQMYFTIRGSKFDIANEHSAALINYIIMVT